MRDVGLFIFLVSRIGTAEMQKVFKRLLEMPYCKAIKDINTFNKKHIFVSDIVILYRNSTELMLLNAYLDGWQRQAALDFDLFFSTHNLPWSTKKKILGSEFPFLIYKVYLSERLRKKIPSILKVYISDGQYYYFFSAS